MYLGVKEAPNTQHQHLAHQKAVIKVFDKPWIDSGDNEIARIQEFDHENIVGYLEHGEVLLQEQPGYQPSPVNFLVEEYVPKGELFDYVTKTGKFSEDLARFYTKQLVSALRHMLKKNLVHRDIKLENLVIDG